jgi:hypothetical protein
MRLARTAWRFENPLDRYDGSGKRRAGIGRMYAGRGLF